MRHRLMIAVVASILSLGAFPGTASSEVTFRTVLQVDFTFFVPCGNSGTGEDVHVTGERTLFTTATTDASGATHVTLHGTPGRLSGVGLTTGDTYHVIGHEDLSINTTGSESASTFTGRSAQRWVLPGGGNDFTVRSVFHITTDPNGDLHFVPRETTVECS